MMNQRFDSVLVEFRCPIGGENIRSEAIEGLSNFLLRQSREFVVDERTFKKEEVVDDPEWAEWLATNSEGYDSGYYRAAFLVAREDHQYFAALFQEYLVQLRTANDQKG